MSEQTQTQTEHLKVAAENVLDLLKITNYADEKKPTALEKREATYELGEQLLVARNELPDDNDFGKWIHEEIRTKFEGSITTKTLFNYRQLAEFTPALSIAVKVGYSNIYKLQQEANAAHKKWVKDNHHLYTKPQLGKIIRALLNSKTSEKVDRAEEIHELNVVIVAELENMKGEDEPEIENLLELMKTS
jgi:hypothetical protein